MIKKWRKVSTNDVAVFVDRSAEDRSAVFLIIDRIVGAAAEEGDPERCTSYDHSEHLLRIDATCLSATKHSALGFMGSVRESLTC